MELQTPGQVSMGSNQQHSLWWLTFPSSSVFNGYVFNLNLPVLNLLPKVSSVFLKGSMSIADHCLKLGYCPFPLGGLHERLFLMI